VGIGQEESGTERFIRGVSVCFNGARVRLEFYALKVIEDAVGSKSLVTLHDVLSGFLPAISSEDLAHLGHSTNDRAEGDELPSRCSFLSQLACGAAKGSGKWLKSAHYAH
jgi:hypothetical protein